MKEGPDIARVASLIGEPARANMLAALIDGRALTASELALEAGVTKQTASAHLARLVDGRLLAVEAQGRHRYFRLYDGEVAALLESLMSFAAPRAGARTRPGPKDPALRRARRCYDHLAGEMGVALLDGMLARRFLKIAADGLDLTRKGRGALADFGLDIETLEARRRPLCRPCLDWSERRAHLGGALGAALLDEILARRWARRVKNSRAIAFTPAGERGLAALIG